MWNTREPLPPAFAEAWSQRLSRSPHHNFSMLLDYLQLEASHGRHAIAALVDGAGRGGAIVLHDHEGEWHSGWPWRWQMVIEDPARHGSVGLDAAEAEWLFAHATALAGSGRLRAFLPMAPPPAVPAYFAGGTLVQSLAHDDAAILGGMDPDKRRIIRRARDKGCEVVEASTPELWRAFAEVQFATKQRHGESPEPVAESPGRGEHWREWELPWMWLLVALQDGQVRSGFGLGLASGGMIEGRTSATSEDGRKLGAFPLLVYEASIRARDRGYRWHNNGGDTFFKRDVVGKLAERVEIHCWLGGGALWAVSNQGEALGRRLAPHVRDLKKQLLDRPAKKKTEKKAEEKAGKQTEKKAEKQA